MDAEHELILACNEIEMRILNEESELLKLELEEESC